MASQCATMTSCTTRVLARPVSPPRRTPRAYRSTPRSTTNVLRDITPEAPIGTPVHVPVLVHHLPYAPQPWDVCLTCEFVFYTRSKHTRTHALTFSRPQSYIRAAEHMEALGADPAGDDIRVVFVLPNGEAQWVQNTGVMLQKHVVAMDAVPHTVFFLPVSVGWRRVFLCRCRCRPF